jgi:hypothetical protein
VRGMKVNSPGSRFVQRSQITAAQTRRRLPRRLLGVDVLTSVTLSFQSTRFRSHRRDLKNIILNERRDAITSGLENGRHIPFPDPVQPTGPLKETGVGVVTTESCVILVSAYYILCSRLCSAP